MIFDVNGMVYNIGISSLKNLASALSIATTDSAVPKQPESADDVSLTHGRWVNYIWTDVRVSVHC